MEDFDVDRFKQVAWTTFTKTLPGMNLVGKLAAAAFVTLGTALYFGQQYLIYPAYAPSGSRTDVPTPDKYGMPFYEDVTLETQDDLKIRAYLMLQGAAQGKEAAQIEAPKRPTVLFLHANAGNMGHRLPFARIFYDRLKCNVFMLSYRGYGLSEGKPSEKGIRSDAQLALDFIKSHPSLEKTPLILYGQSLGGAVAIQLAAERSESIAGIILENTFLSLSKVATAAMPVASPYIWFGLLRDRWQSADAVIKIPAEMPALFLSGSMDEIVPPKQMLTLFETCTSKRKKLHRFEFGTHNDTCVAPDYWKIVQRFIHNEVLCLPQREQPDRSDTFDEKRVDGVEQSLDGTIGAGSLVP